MKEIKDKKLLEKYYKSVQCYFSVKPKVIKLIEYKKGELLNSPLNELDTFLIVVKGKISIYDISYDGAIRYISLASKDALLGDVEFCGKIHQSFYTEATSSLICLSIPFKENKEILENDPVFLRFVLNKLTDKLFFSAKLESSSQTLEERVLFYLQKVTPNHELTSINETLKILHCSRRQLQRVLKKLCDSNILVKEGRGNYKLK